MKLVVKLCNNLCVYNYTYVFTYNYIYNFFSWIFNGTFSDGNYMEKRSIQYFYSFFYNKKNLCMRFNFLLLSMRKLILEIYYY